MAAPIGKTWRGLISQFDDKFMGFLLLTGRSGRYPSRVSA